MAEEKKALIIELRPKFKQLREQRTYSEAHVKRILFGFARDLGCKWENDRLRKFIDTALIIELRPKFKQLRVQRTYTEADVKRILFAFARNLGCKWEDDRLRKFIDTAFDFD